MSQFTPIRDPNDINLHHNAVIEASAGTGKTYTLIELVLRLLIEEQVALDQILLVTFTDKATAELRSRIREGLLKTIDAAEDKGLKESDIEHLERSLKQVNQAPIFTINAFCQNMLRKFAFEQGNVFDFELIEDKEVFQRQINQLKRTWAANPEIQAAFKKLGKTPKEVEDTLLALPSSIDLDRELIWPSSGMSVEELANSIADHCKVEYQQLILSQSEKIKFKQKPTNSKVSTIFIKVFSEVLEFKNGTQSSQNFLVNFFEPIEFNPTETGLYKFISNSQKVGFEEQNESNAKDLFEFLELLKQWKTAFDSLKFAVIKPLLLEIQSLSEQYKLNHGLISYDDMINRLHQKVMNERNLLESEQLLTQQMRKKFKYAMIDEFQDTSFNQWEIFKTLFFDSKDHRLMVIGDPKQAIYAFRGADVKTYWSAKDEMLGSGQAKGYRLATNYRSLPDILKGFNQFFGDKAFPDGHWWPDDEVVVQAAPNEHLESQGPQVLGDPTGTAAINGFGVSDQKYAADEFREAMAEQVAMIVKEQVLDADIQVRLKGQDRSLNASDVCVLVSGNREAESLEKAFDGLGVSHTYHKKKKLFQSDEALHYQVLLTALAHSHDRKQVNNALITMFFSLKPDQLQAFANEKLPEINQRWLALKEAAADGDWLALFDLLLHKSGVFMTASLQGLTRRVANLKQIKNLLCETALANNLDVKGLLQWLVEKRDDKKDESLHNKASDDDAVNIMTMHVSKGLEFPVVFLFGGFGKIGGNDKKYTKYPDPESGVMVYDLNRNKELAFDYESQERKRLFYVAMTRAVFKLYLPIYNESQFDGATDSHYANQVVSRFEQVKTGEGFNPKLIQTQYKQEHAINGTKVEIDRIPQRPLAVPCDVWARQRKIFSFSSLSHNKKAASTEDTAFGEASTTEKALITGDAEAKSPQAVDWTKILPGGIKTGHVLHGIFENVDFQRFKAIDDLNTLWQDEAIMAVVDDQMTQFRMENGEIFDDQGQVIRDHRQELAAWVWHTLKKPLAALNGGILADVLPEDRCHEMAFFWQKEQTHLTGFIDLLFGVKTDIGMDYFILDWKSNYSASGYSPEVLNQEVMAEHQYHWQYQLYGMAVQKWFDALGLKNARLAGAIYLFSRGIDCHDTESQNGVFYDDFFVSDYSSAAVEKELLQIAQNGAGQ